jgi:hypothetical protein
MLRATPHHPVKPEAEKPPIEASRSESGGDKRRLLTARYTTLILKTS